MLFTHILDHTLETHRNNIKENIIEMIWKRYQKIRLIANVIGIISGADDTIIARV